MTESYTYNGNWQRVAQTNGISSSNELYEGASTGSPLIEDANATYTPGLSEERGGTDYTYHADAQGSTRGITAGGAVTDAVLYDAFGNTISRSGSTPTPVLYNGAAGYQTDSATGLQLLGHRYYDPSIGRFLSSDPAQAGTNWYAYCDNSPLIREDASGLCWWKQLLKVLLCVPTDAIIEVGGLGPEDPAADVGCYAADVKIAEAVDDLGETGAEGTDGSTSGGGSSSTGGNTGGSTGSDTGGNTGSGDNSTGGDNNSTGNSNSGSINDNRGGFHGCGRAQIELPRGTYTEDTIGGRRYSGHAIERMVGRGIPPSVIEDTINNGVQQAGDASGTTVHTSSNATVVTSDDDGGVVTLWPNGGR